MGGNRVEGGKKGKGREERWKEGKKGRGRACMVEGKKRE